MCAFMAASDHTHQPASRNMVLELEHLFVGKIKHCCRASKLDRIEMMERQANAREYEPDLGSKALLPLCSHPDAFIHTGMLRDFFIQIHFLTRMPQ
jgi:hypothetical protein